MEHGRRTKKRRRLGGGKSRRLLKEALQRRDGDGCCFCSCPLTLTEATLEHIQPFAFGGTNDPRNLTLSCSPCNQRRGTRQFSAFKREAAPKLRKLRPCGEKVLACGTHQGEHG